MTARKHHGPPLVVWVTYCARCGIPIFADTHKNTSTTCPDCPATQRKMIRKARYELAHTRAR